MMKFDLRKYKTSLKTVVLAFPITTAGDHGLAAIFVSTNKKGNGRDSIKSIQVCIMMLKSMKKQMVTSLLG